MKGKHAKNTANKQKLAKRMLALCFAVVFLCSCVLPVFATGSSLLTDALREAVEETAASTDTSTEAGGGTMMDDFQTMVSSSEYKTTYRFWLSAKDSYDLPDAAMTSASDLKPYADFYAVAAIVNNTTLTAPEGFQNPTDPTDEGRTFEGWYYIDTYGLTQTFTFDDSPVLLDKSATIDVFAKWGEAPADDPADDADKTEGDTKADDTVKDDTKADDTVKDETKADDTKADDGDEEIPPTPEVDGEEIPVESEESVALADAYDDVVSLAATERTTIKLEESVQLNGESGSRNSSSHHHWTQSGSGSVSISYPYQNRNDYHTAIVTGAKSGSVTVTHQYWSQGKWRQEKFELYVDKVYGATVFILKTPTSDRDSNGSGDWGVGIPGAVIDVAGATWEDINIKQNVVNHVVSWPDGTLNAGMYELKDGTKAWDMPRDIKGWTYTWDNGGQREKTVLDQILEHWGAELEKKFGIKDLSADDIKHIYVVPYKISHNASNSGKITRMHIDCEIQVVCTKAYVARFKVQNPEETDYKAISFGNYEIRKSGSDSYPDSIPENNGKEYPKTKSVNGVQYVFDGWYNEAGERVDAWEYTPNAGELDDGVVNFYGRYVRANTTFTIEKQVTGNMADLSEQFNFTITVQDSERKNLTFKVDGEEYTGTHDFKLGNGDSVSLTDVPVGATITIQEKDATGYLTSAKLGNSYVGGQNQQDGGIFSFTVAEATTATQTMDDDEIGLMLLSLDDDVDTESATAGQKILVINSKDLEVPTGVILDTLPYVLMLIAVGGGVVAFFLRKRHHDDEE